VIGDKASRGLTAPDSCLSHMMVDRDVLCDKRGTTG